MIINFFKEHGFVLELLVATFIFVYSLNRKKYFTGRIIAVIFSMFLISILYGLIPSSNFFIVISKYTIMFIIMAFGIRISFDISLWGAFSLGISAYAIQHIYFKIGSLLQTIIYINNDLTNNIIYLVAVFLLYSMSFIFFKTFNYNSDKTYEKYNINTVITFIALILISIVFHNIFEFYTNITEKAALITLGLFDILSTTFILILQFNILSQNKLEQEKRILEHILYKQKEQFDNSKQSVDLINVKFHDLKYQLSYLEHKLDKSEIEELNKTLALYDTKYNTGSESLDIILSEKKLICEKENINLTFIADGSLLSFILPSEIYSLFGNAIDNAIHALKNFSENTKKYIYISIREVAGRVSIVIQNYFEGNLTFENNLPLTTKLNKDYHGFGIKSIKLIVDKYKGNLNISYKDNKFTLSILF